MRQLLSIATLACLVVLSACGGGGGSSSNSASTTPSTNVAGSNVASITIGAGPVTNGAATTSPNIPFVTVTICKPGTSTCAQVDHVQVDTGSAGLRLVSSQAISSLGLTAQTASGGGTLGECAQFADGVTWGAVRAADVHIAGETASNIGIEIIGDAAVPTPPTDCTANSSTKQTVAALGANGILGIGTLATDCGTACAQQAVGIYFSCISAVCTGATVPVASQVPNPVARFASDNNGSLVMLPALPAGGSATAQGSLIFGIGTQSNNALTGVTVYKTNSAGQFTATFSGTQLSQSLLDTGSNGLFFPDGSIPPCATTSNASGFFCPTSTTAVSATITGTNGATTTASLSIGNAQTLFASGNFAYNDIGGPFTGTPTFDFGLPFFYGRPVYTAISGANTTGGAGPYIAF